MSVLNASLQPIPASSSAGAASPATSTSASSTSRFNAFNAQTFMQLLTAQLQNQDPTNPASEQQLASEMAQFSTATGVNNLNTNVEALAQAQSAGTLAKASALIGKQVAVPGNALVSGDNNQATGAFSLAAPAGNAVVNVTDASGKTVGTIRLANLGAGSHTFNWNAPAANTAYNFTVAADSTQGVAVAATPKSLYTVSGVVQSAGKLALSLAGNPNPLPINEVSEIL